jgi:hypothetical protein
VSTSTTSGRRDTLHTASANGVVDAVPRSATVRTNGRVRRCLHWLDRLGYEVIHLGHLSDVHVQALARFWLHVGATELKTSNRLAALHGFVGQLTGREPRNRVTAHLACARAVLSACRARRAMCWSAVGIDVDGMLRRIALHDRYVAMQLSLQRAYALSVAEVLTLRPHEAERRDCLVVENDQGKRRIPIETLEQRTVLDAAKLLVPYPGALLHAVGTPVCDVPNRYHSACFEAGFSRLRLLAHWIRFEPRLADVLAAAATPDCTRER